MEKLIKASLKNRQVTILLSFFIICMGLYYYIMLPKQENPDTSSPAARIITVFPGASPKDVESLVTIPIEDGIASVGGIEKIESRSYNSYSVVIVFLDYSSNKDEKWSEIRDQIEIVSKDLPEGCLAPDMDNKLTDSAGIIISLSGENYEYDKLTQFANVVKRSLEGVEGVTEFQIEGDIEKEVLIEVSHKKLALYNVSLNRINDVLKAQNVSIPPGSIDTESGKITVQVNGTFENLRDIENVILDISKETGGIVRLKDLAKISIKEKRGQPKFEQNEKNAVLISGYFDKDENIVHIGKNVRELLDKQKNNLPKDLLIDEVLFLPEDVKYAVDDFMRNLLMAILFVVIVILVGMGLRNALVVATAIPLSIMATFDVMAIMHIDVQQMSIAALIVALGILVDNAIVISDAIQVKINNGEKIFDACLNGAKEQSIPVLTSTLTTIAAFLPLTQLSGEAGEFVSSLPMVVMIALSASYLVAMLVTPVFAKYLFKVKKSKIKRSFLREFFSKGLKFALKNKALTMVLSISIFIGSLFLIKFTTINLFPYVDKDFLYVDVYSEVLGDIEATEMLVDEVVDTLKEEECIKDISVSIGRALPRFYITVSTYPPAEDFAQILFKIDLTKGNYESREVLAYELEKKINKRVARGKAFVKLVELNEPGPDIRVKLLGTNRSQTEEVAKEVEGILRSFNSTKNISSDVTPSHYGYHIEIDEDRASMLGLTKYDVQRQVNIALYGANSTIFRKEGNDIDVILKTDISSIADLENLKIFSQFTNKGVLLKQIAKLTYKEETPILKRIDRQEAYNVSTNIKPGYSTTMVQSRLEEEIDKIDLKNVLVKYGGDKEVFNKYVKSIGVAAIFAVFVIYIILLIQFNSIVQPLIILGTVPLSFVGSIIGMVIFKQEITLTVLLGVASLVGIVVNNAILLLEYINRARKEGLSVEEACKQSADKRLRPILLSTITTMIGLVPLVLWGSSFIKPMAVALMNGLGVATLLTLIVIPTLYSIVMKEKN